MHALDRFLEVRVVGLVHEGTVEHKQKRASELRKLLFVGFVLFHNSPSR